MPDLSGGEGGACGWCSRGRRSCSWRQCRCFSGTAATLGTPWLGALLRVHGDLYPCAPGLLAAWVALEQRPGRHGRFSASRY